MKKKQRKALTKKRIDAAVHLLDMQMENQMEQVVHAQEDMDYEVFRSACETIVFCQAIRDMLTGSRDFDPFIFKMYYKYHKMNKSDSAFLAKLAEEIKKIADVYEE